MTIRTHHILIAVVGLCLGIGFLVGAFLRAPSAFGAAPAVVTAVVPSPGNGQVVLKWTNPADAGFTGTMVRYSTIAFPTSVSDGTLASDVVGSPSGTSSYTLTGLANGTIYYFSLFSHNGTPEYSAAVNAQQLVMPTAFSDDFQSDSVAAISGQNGWTTLAGAWNVVDTSGEKTLRSSAVSIGFETDRVLNGGNVATYSDQMIRVDWKGSTTLTPGQVFLRAQSASADAGGYFMWQSGGTVRLNYKNNAGVTQVQLASASFTPIVDTWYTYEFSVVNNSAGLPVLTGYVWARGTAKPSTPTLQVTDTINRFAQGVFSVGKTGTSVNDYDNVVYSGRIGDSSANVAPGNQANKIGWTNPVYANYAGTMVRSSTTSYPTSITDGTLVGNITGSSGAKNTVTHSGLTNGTLYYYTLFPYDTLGVYGTPVYLSQYAYSALFTDNFNTLNAGNIVGQNSWTSSGGTWNVGTVLGQTALIGSGTATYPTNRAINGGSQTTNQILTEDFLSDTASNTAGYVWLRRQADGSGYIVWHNANAWQISYYASAALTTIASATATATPPMDANVWFHQEVSVINNNSGLPVITLYVWKDGMDKPTVPTLQVTDASDRFVQGSFALGKNGGAATADYDNVAFYGTGPVMSISSPAAAVLGAPNVATLSIVDEGGTIFIPYIQTSTTLNVAASAGAVPIGGGVQFVLNEGLGSSQTVTDLVAPYSASFTGLAKGTYTLDAYVLDADGATRLADAASHDRRTGIAIGDIIAVVGDSVTEGQGGNIDSGTVTSWLDADAGMASADNRNFPQYGTTSTTYNEGFLSDLNDKLAAYYGYPVFLMNEGRGGIRANNYQSGVMNAAWQSRINALAPNKWIVQLGINDNRASDSPSTFQTNITNLVNTFISSYGATAANTWLMAPSYDFGAGGQGAYAPGLATYLPIITSVRNSLGLQGGADLYNIFAPYHATQYFDNVHPNATGYAHMARAEFLSMIAPTASSITAVGPTQVTVNWTSITAAEPTIAGYHVKYGTASNALTQTATFGDVTSGTITSLTPNTLYYFAVEAYDNDAAYVAVTDQSNTLSATTQSVATMTSAITADVNANGHIDRMMVTFSEDLDGATVAGADFTVTGYTVSSASETAPGVVTLVLAEGVAADTAGTPLVSIVGSVSNTLGGPTTSGTQVPTDGAAPVLLSAVAQDVNVNGYIDRILATFSEDLDGATVTGSDFGVGTYTVASATETSATLVTIDLIEGMVIDTGATPLVSLIGSVADVPGNVQTSGSVTPSDAATPVLLSGRTQDTDANGRLDHIELTFSKDLDGATIDAADVFVAAYAVSDAQETSAGVVTISLVEGSFDDTGSTPLVTIIGSMSDTIGNTTSSGFVTPTDAAAPVIVAVTPADGSTAVLRNVTPSVTFSETMNISTVTYSIAPAVADGAVVWSAGETVLTLTHGSLLFPVTSYALTITAGNDAVGVSFTGARSDIGYPAHFTTVPSDESVAEDSVAASEPTVTVVTPNGGDMLISGQSAVISWSSTNESSMPFVSLSYSIDDGASYSAIVENIPNIGSYVWTVPSVVTTRARVLIQGGDLLTFSAQDASDRSFTMTSPASDAVVDVPAEDTSVPTTVVNVGEGRSPFTGAPELLTEVSVGDIIQAPDYETVYMVTADGKRRPFVDEQTLYTYITHRSEIKIVTSATLPQMIVGAPMLPNPGTVLVKMQSDSHVYWLEAGAETSLRWLTTESLSREMIGGSWADYVIDIPPTLYSRFPRGADITEPFAIDRSRLRARWDLHE